MMRIGILLAVAIAGTCSSATSATEIVDGTTGPGSSYRLIRPDNWNGRLLLYAHGYKTKDEPVGLPAEADALSGALASQGFALAYSSFSENGWVVQDGVVRTQQLIGLFAAKFGPPTGVYISGASMGGLIAIELAERFPARYIGALPVCPVAGGTRAQYDYSANVRALFDLFYPGVLPGNAGYVAPSVDPVFDVAVPAWLAVQADANGLAAMTAIEQTPMPFATQEELLSSLLTALTGHAESFRGLVPELHDKPYFDNLATVYAGALPQPVLDTINASVGRFAASPAALQYMDAHYLPTGRIAAPMVMLSTSRDPVVPEFHEQIYQQLATQAGSGPLLFQRTIDRYGHCAFTPAEIVQAFADLVAWVEFGIAPTP